MLRVSATMIGILITLSINCSHKYNQQPTSERTKTSTQKYMWLPKKTATLYKTTGKEALFKEIVRLHKRVNELKIDWQKQQKIITQLQKSRSLDISSPSRIDCTKNNFNHSGNNSADLDFQCILYESFTPTSESSQEEGFDE